jgi:hypothetical protein
MNSVLRLYRMAFDSSRGSAKKPLHDRGLSNSRALSSSAVTKVSVWMIRLFNGKLTRSSGFSGGSTTRRYLKLLRSIGLLQICCARCYNVGIGDSPRASRESQ